MQRNKKNFEKTTCKSVEALHKHEKESDKQHQAVSRVDAL